MVRGHAEAAASSPPPERALRQGGTGTGRDRRVPPHPAARRLSLAWRHDDRGQLLILTGVLLVLGFVVIGTTVVQLRALEENTSRLERDALLDSVDQLVANFNRTIVDSVEIGDTNTTDFKERVRLGEARLRDTATRSGLYVSINLRENPDKSVFWRDSRCGAYEPAYVKDGIIIGYDRETQRETIAGAVYDMHITDGRQSIRMDYYVKVFECMLRNSPSFVDGTSQVTGTVDNLTGSKQRQAVDKGHMWVNETLSGETVKSVWSPPKANATSVGWSSTTKIEAEDASTANHVVPTVVNQLLFEITRPADLDNGPLHTIPDFKISVLAHHSLGLGGASDDRVYLEGFDKDDLTQTLLYQWPIPLTTSLTNFTFEPAQSPTGNSYWTKQDVENITWRVKLVNIGLPDSGRIIRVDYVHANMTWEQPLGYQVEAYFDFFKVPTPYDTHYVNMTYTVVPDGANPDPDEVFYLQVYDDSVVGDWTTIKEMRASEGTHTINPPIELQDSEENGNAPRFRIVDPVDDDDEAYDDHSIEIDYFELMSKVTG